MIGLWPFFAAKPTEAIFKKKHNKKNKKKKYVGNTVAIHSIL
jgi:hypothetical protein